MITAILLFFKFTTIIFPNNFSLYLKVQLFDIDYEKILNLRLLLKKYSLLPMREKLDGFYDTVLKNSRYKNKKNLKRHLNYIFNNFDFNGKKILDVGGGMGLLSVYAALLGSEAICLEPESFGSTIGIQNNFNKLAEKIDCKNRLEFVSETFQEFNFKKKSFDLIVVANAINHLNEDACIRLPEETAENEYNLIFKKMRDLLKENGKLIITDCSSSNFFNDIGLKNPLMPSIEWHKHQSPSTWSNLLIKNGFKNTIISWSSFNTLVRLGRILMNNKYINYLTLSHFRIEASLNSL